MAHSFITALREVHTCSSPAGVEPAGELQTIQVCNIHLQFQCQGISTLPEELRPANAIDGASHRFPTRIKGEGIAICHSQERILFYTADPEMGWRGVDNWGADTQKEVVPKKKTFFVIEKYVEGVKQVKKISWILWNRE